MLLGYMSEALKTNKKGDIGYSQATNWDRSYIRKTGGVRAGLDLWKYNVCRQPHGDGVCPR